MVDDEEVARLQAQKGVKQTEDEGQPTGGFVGAVDDGLQVQYQDADQVQYQDEHAVSKPEAEQEPCDFLACCMV